MSESTFPYPTEDALLAALRQGHPEAYEQLIEQYADGVYRVAYRLLQNPQDAEDALQETFLTVYLQIGDFRGDAKLSSWLYRIVTNKALDILRRRQRKTDAATEALEDLGEETAERLAAPQSVLPEDWLERREIAELIEQGLAALSPRLRAAFVLFEMEGLSMQETAAALNVSLSTAKVRVHRARQALRTFLSQHLHANAAETLTGKDTPIQA